MNPNVTLRAVARAALVFAVVAAAGAASSCRPRSHTRYVLVTVSASAAIQALPIAGLHVVFSTSTMTSPQDLDAPSVWPTTFSGEIPDTVTDDITVTVQAVDDALAVLASGATAPFVATNDVTSVSVTLFSGGGCPNGTCDAGETAATCPADCSAAVCPNGVCEAGEDVTSCPADCTGPVCGDGACDAGEDTASCPIDCPAGACGDGSCNIAAGEDAMTCPTDCFCGNGSCEPNEDPTVCPADCGGGPVCGNGLCEPGEMGSCPGDCPCNFDGTCAAPETAASCSDCALCGDGICTPPETFSSCFDCVPVCGDSVCAPSCEGPGSCSSDCPIVCGDSRCSTGETQATCMSDCGSGLPSGWSCPASYYGDGICDCGCGIPDPDCMAMGCTAPNCCSCGACAGCAYCWPDAGACQM
jgi:hypothetical protein